MRQAGFDVGDAWPLHFVVEGDLHLALDGVFLHRTVKMPPCDEEHVSIEAAFVAFCAGSRLLDAIRLGSVLLNTHLLDLGLLDQILDEEKWRCGVPETAYALLLTARKGSRGERPETLRHIQPAEQFGGPRFAEFAINAALQQRLHHNLQRRHAWDHPQKLADPAQRVATQGDNLAR